MTILEIEMAITCHVSIYIVSHYNVEYSHSGRMAAARSPPVGAACGMEKIFNFHLNAISIFRLIEDDNLHGLCSHNADVIRKILLKFEKGVLNNSTVNIIIILVICNLIYMT